jgi:hypothetical protein
VPLEPEDQKKTAFITKYGLFEFKRMGFGLCNAPATYARIMSLVLCGLSWEVVLSFLDDILALGKTFEEHLKNLRDIFLRFRKNKLKLKPRNASCFASLLNSWADVLVRID